jgi:hypothetical protein
VVGVDRKWSALADEREQLREERDALRAEVGRLLAERASWDALDKHGLGLDESEQEAFSAISFVHDRILREWALAPHCYVELTAAVHVIQNFIIQRMLSRLAPDRWANFYQDERKDREVGQAS